jgi:hypothetical protein
MLRLFTRHVRSNVVGYIALFVALTGTAIALPGRNSVDSGDIRNGQVRSVDVKNGGLRYADSAVQVTEVDHDFGTIAANSCVSAEKDVPRRVRYRDHVVALPPAGVGGAEDYFAGNLVVNGGPPLETAGGTYIRLRVCNPTGVVGLNPPGSIFRVFVFR